MVFTDPDGKAQVGLEQFVEGHMVDGKFVVGPWLNSDQIHQGRHVDLAPDANSVLRVRLYRYK